MSRNIWRQYENVMTGMAVLRYGHATINRECHRCRLLMPGALRYIAQTATGEEMSSRHFFHII